MPTGDHLEQRFSTRGQRTTCGLRPSFWWSASKGFIFLFYVTSHSVTVAHSSEVVRHKETKCTKWSESL